MRRRASRRMPLSVIWATAAFSLAVGLVFPSAAQSRVASLGGVDAASPSTVAGQKLAPVADAYVSSAKPKSNYGSATRLKADDAPLMQAYLRFNSALLTGNVTRATLWLYAVTGSSVGYTVHSVADNSWQESTVTYANAPLIAVAPLDSISSYGSGSWTAVDVTSALNATGSLDLALTTASGNALSLGSRESGSKSPVLVVETAISDTTAPSPPTNFGVSSSSGSSIAVGWSGSSDNVGVVGYGLYRGGVLVGSVGSAGAMVYTFSGLVCGSSYALGVDAVDAAGNRSAQASLVAATSPCPDSIAPSAPGNVTVTAVTGSGVSLFWSPSLDNVGVAGYELLVNGSKVGTTAGTSFSFSGLSCATSYVLGVRAFDAAGNVSVVSSVGASTAACADAVAPSAPSGLVATAATQTGVALSWSASSDNVGVAGYSVYLNGGKVGSVAGTGYSFAGLVCGTSYLLGVAAFDAAGNSSSVSVLSAATSACPAGSGGGSVKYRFAYSNRVDQASMPSYGYNLIDVSTKSEADATPAGTLGQVWLYDYDNTTCSWEKDDTYIRNMVSSMADDPKVAGFYFSNEPHWWDCPNAVQQHKDRNALIHSLAPNKYTLIGIDGNDRPHFDAMGSMWKGAADYINYNPYICYASDTSTCDFAWEDHVMQVADAQGVPYFIALQAFKEGTEWRWPTASEEQQMLAKICQHPLIQGYLTFSWDWQNDPLVNHPDVLGAIQNFNLNGCGGSSADTSAPTAPANLAATSKSQTSVTLSWSASSDNVAVTGYNVYRGSSIAGSTTATSYTVSGLSCGSSYTFAVEAKDAAGNLSPRSTLTTTTAACSSPGPDTTPPSVPGGLQTTAVTATSVAVSWTAASDNVAVAGYGLYRNGTSVGSTTQTSYSFGGLSCGNSYTLAVDAYDAAGNRSQQATLVASTSPCPDTIAPSAPGNLTVTASTATSLSLLWSPSLDNVAVAGYDLFQNGNKIGSTLATNYTVSGLTCNTNYTLGVQAFDAAGNHSPTTSVGGTTSACPAPPPPTSSDPVVAAAGDICASATDCAPTATLLDQINPTRVLTLGDNAYNDGAASEYTSYYDPNWGRVKSKTSPAPGNHEYHTAGAAGYFGYFGSQAPAPYYSYDLGAWHVISLASDAGVSPAAGGTEETWLKADLAAHPTQCTLAYWHEPRWSSGTTHGNDSSWSAVWNDLYNAHADLVLNGHEHNYERFAPQNPNGTADPKGIREIVAGTGGASHGYPFGTPLPNSEVRNDTTWGVLKLTLHPTSYDWTFTPIAGSTFTDSGTTTCN
jgi:chitodextrinase